MTERISRSVFPELMAKALNAYSDDHISGYFERVKREGLKEHGFCRLTSDIGLLCSMGIRRDLLPLFLEMMDFCCESIPRGGAANDFSVREIVICLEEIEKSGLVLSERTGAWREALGRIDPYKTYDVYAKTVDDNVRNWALFTALSEFVRLRAGIGGSIDFIELQIEQQLRWFDENGMYCDRKGEGRQPIVYDLVPRVLFSLLLHFGYEGRFRDRIDEILRKAGELTLRMQSETGEIPFGGRSNQFVHNEAWLCAVLEYEAARYRAEGDTERALAFRAGSVKALGVIDRWMSFDIPKHVKNRFPTDSRYGCEGYGYFDKYMITTASILHSAYLLSDPLIPWNCGELPRSDAFALSSSFHKVFLRNGGYFSEFDLSADPKYDASGLGRLHRKGTPPEICLSVPCPSSDESKYFIDLDSSRPLSICPALFENGEWTAFTGSGMRYDLIGLSSDENASRADFVCASSDGSEIRSSFRLDGNGLFCSATGQGAVGIMLPAFAFDGSDHVEHDAEEQRLRIFYKGYICEYTTDGLITDAGYTCGNRNGYYRAYRASGNGSIGVRIRILPGCIEK